MSATFSDPSPPRRDRSRAEFPGNGRVGNDLVYGHIELAVLFADRVVQTRRWHAAGRKVTKHCLSPNLEMGDEFGRVYSTPCANQVFLDFPICGEPWCVWVRKGALEAMSKWQKATRRPMSLCQFWQPRRGGRRRKALIPAPQNEHWPSQWHTPADPRGLRTNRPFFHLEIGPEKRYNQRRSR